MNFHCIHFKIKKVLWKSTEKENSTLTRTSISEFTSFNVHKHNTETMQKYNLKYIISSFEDITVHARVCLCPLQNISITYANELLRGIPQQQHIYDVNKSEHCFKQELLSWIIELKIIRSCTDWVWNSELRAVTL